MRALRHEPPTHVALSLEVDIHVIGFLLVDSIITPTISVCVLRDRVSAEGVCPAALLITIIKAILIRVGVAEITEAITVGVGAVIALVGTTEDRAVITEVPV